MLWVPLSSQVIFLWLSVFEMVDSEVRDKGLLRPVSAVVAQQGRDKGATCKASSSEGNLSNCIHRMQGTKVRDPKSWEYSVFPKCLGSH